MSSISASSSSFAWSLFSVISDQHPSENVFFSPASVQVALAMTLAGAKGETHSELVSSLHLSQLESPHSEIGKLIAAINSARSGVKLAVANRLFGEKSFSIEEEFSGVLSKSYSAQLGSVNFKEQWEAAREEINRWVEQQTNSKIRDLLASGTVNPDTRLVLVNAIYFKGDWQHTFKKEATYDGQFEPRSGSSTPVRMMSQSRRFPYAEGLGLRVVRLEFSGGSCSMLIVLPQERHGLSAALKGIRDLREILELAGRASSQEVELHLPRFKAESELTLSDPPYLPAIGIRRLFSRTSADLSGISRSEALYVSKVIHKAFLEVNEEGAEAAAATAVVMVRRCAVIVRKVPFFVTEPFLVLIKDEATEAVLFAGRINQPKD